LEEKEQRNLFLPIKLAVCRPINGSHEGRGKQEGEGEDVPESSPETSSEVEFPAWIEVELELRKFLNSERAKGAKGVKGANYF
jgi:hypothetical protein